MKLIIGNGAVAGTVVTVVDGSKPGVEELGASSYTTVDSDCTVVVVGDKPNLAEQLEKVAQTIGALLRKILQKIERRKLGRAVIEQPEDMLYISLANNGTLPVRVILGDGVTDEQLDPLGSMKVQCKGYVELRELGHVQQSDDPAQQLGAGA